MRIWGDMRYNVKQAFLGGVLVTNRSRSSGGLRRERGGGLVMEVCTTCYYLMCILQRIVSSSFLQLHGPHEILYVFYFFVRSVYGT